MSQQRTTSLDTSSNLPKYKIGITMGEANGISVEIILKLFQKRNVFNDCLPVIYGSQSIWKAWGDFWEKTKNTEMLLCKEYFEQLLEARKIQFVSIPTKLNRIQPGRLVSQSGRLAFDCLKQAVEDALNRKIQALVTAPINKLSLKAANLPYPGHTEILADLTQIKNYAMAFYTPKFWVVLATIHIALSEVPSQLSKETLYEKLLLIHQAARKLGYPNPRIAVCGLNPHAGEGGLWGDEEAKIIQPAIVKALSQSIIVEGPLSADTVFYKAVQGKYDFILAMYHDQGLIPVKTLFFSESVNVTLGLPIIRTSVDHGTAFDIAGKNLASEANLYYAFELARKLAQKNNYKNN